MNIEYNIHRLSTYLLADMKYRETHHPHRPEGPPPRGISEVTRAYFLDWDRLRIPGAVGNIEDTIRQNILNMERKGKAQDYVLRYAESHGLSVEHYLTAVQKHLESLLSQASYFKNCFPSVLEDVLNGSGRFKSQFETNGSGGFFSPIDHSHAEEQLFGFPDDPDKNKTKRPIYGYLSDSSSGEVRPRGRLSNVLEQYGNITIKLKTNVSKKTTFTMEDSFDFRDELRPTPVSKPHFTSVPWGMGDPLTMESISTPHGLYVEAQYHGGLTFEDIESIHVHKERITQEEYSRIQEIMTEYHNSERGARNPIAVVEY